MATYPHTQTTMLIHLDTFQEYYQEEIQGQIDNNEYDDYSEIEYIFEYDYE